ncbi:hypothetical protein LCGC14_1082970 [marine sediment metagenome]|uniref:Uncharacterized protein n=1 Tax=marine sediment metagenome TaxID=412755 RepID=A0A0F9QKN1_9ZZZZ
MKDWTPIRFVEYIDQQYFNAKKRKLSRMSITWGSWSRNMNLVLRKKTEDGNQTDPETTKFKYVFNYWVARSQLLELHFKSKMFGGAKKKNLTEELREIKSIIDGTEELKEIGTMEEMAIRKILKK